MTVKALSIVSILALAAAGTACSQSSEQDSANSEAPAETVAEAEVDMSGFNLGLPTEMESTTASSAGEFNLAVDGTGSASTDGFNLAADIPASNGLADIPEIGTNIGEDTTEETPELPTDDEPVIRLD